MVTGNAPQTHLFRTWGCSAWCINKLKPGKDDLGKLNMRGQATIMIGQKFESDSYLLYDPKDKCIRERRDVILDEEMSNISANRLTLLREGIIVNFRGEVNDKQTIELYQECLKQVKLKQVDEIEQQIDPKQKEDSERLRKQIKL